MGVATSATLHHTGFVVHDVEASATALVEALGIRPWAVFTIEPPRTTVRGREVPFSFRIAIAAIGSSHYELLAPLEGASIYVEHLTAHGEGFHHTCFAYSTHDELPLER